MSLTPHDLIHCGFYYHTDPENGSIYQYDAVKCGFKATDQAHFQGFTDYGPELLGFFEPIPLTPEILRDWFDTGETDSGILLNSQEDEELEELIPFGEFGWQVLGYSSGDHIAMVSAVHELQALIYTLHKTPLEGGPK